jgi:ABC-type multidrug transport system permease subunit
MRPEFEIVRAACLAELIQLRRSPLLIILTSVQALTFIFLVSLFGMTGAMAPTAIIDDDRGGRAQAFIQDLHDAHHSFSLITTMSSAEALNALKHGNLVAMITIPKKFTFNVLSRRNTAINVVVDNIDTDMTEDIQRALPSAIVAFGRRLHLPNRHVQVEETDLIDHDTGFISYLVASSLVLAAFIIACNLSAVAVAREFENRTAVLLNLCPSNPLFVLLGRLLGSSAFSFAALLPAVAVAVFGFGLIPVHPLETMLCLLLCVFSFAALGAALGACLKRTLPVASLVFGMALPFYLVSGSYEPERFDGNLIWTIAHCSPVYYAVGIIEHAIHGLRVTPESTGLNFAILIAWAAVFLGIAAAASRLKVSER